MALFLEAHHIASIWTALSKPPPTGNPDRATKLLRKFASDGWATPVDIEDFFFTSDHRLDREIDVEVFATAFGLQWRNTFYAPKSRSNSVVGFLALAAADAASFLIWLEQLGFMIDVTPLADALVPRIKQQSKITDSELSVLWYTKRRHRMSEVCIQATDALIVPTGIKQLITTTGYKAELSTGSDDQPVGLSVRAPKYRRRPNPVETECPDCGYKWWRGDPDSSAEHRQEHRKRMKILQPSPHPRVADALIREKNPELVTYGSPGWKHKEMYERACVFRREFHYDFVQWDAPPGDHDPDAHGFLFIDDAMAIVGACAFRLRTVDDQKHWGLQWVWICPGARRAGVLEKRWAPFKARFGKFVVEGPVSSAMKAFLAKNGDTDMVG
ncbi:hypothetical protein BH10PSE6_BH10PSE6_08080 [soil metagenome]